MKTYIAHASVQAATDMTSQRLMWLGADRAIYNGLLGMPSERCLGGFSFYVSFRGSHRIRIADGPWQECKLSFVPPYVRHRIVADDRMICNILVEAETVDSAALPQCAQGTPGAVEDPLMVCRALAALGRYAHGVNPPWSTNDFDHHFFGRAWAPMRLDRRIDTVLHHVKAAANSRLSAQECAALVFLSGSRFLHLFTAEVGIPFRKFKSWKRARSVLYYVTQSTRLTDIALDVGYPDATHFSHCIRQVYGLTPKSMFAGSRRLVLCTGPGRPALEAA